MRDKKTIISKRQKNVVFHDCFYFESQYVLAAEEHFFFSFFFLMETSFASTRLHHEEEGRQLNGITVATTSGDCETRHNHAILFLSHLFILFFSTTPLPLFRVPHMKHKQYLRTRRSCPVGMLFCFLHRNHSFSQTLKKKAENGWQCIHVPAVTHAPVNKDGKL